MPIPVQVTFHDLPISDAVESMCWRETQALEHDWPQLSGCRVIVLKAPENGRQLDQYEIRIDLTLVGEEQLTHRSPVSTCRGASIDDAIHDAFTSVLTLLRDRHDPSRGAYPPREARPITS